MQACGFRLLSVFFVLAIVVVTGCPDGTSSTSVPEPEAPFADAGPTDAGPVANDGGLVDAGSTNDAGQDADGGPSAVSDAGPIDAGRVDAGGVDAGETDPSHRDAGPSVPPLWTCAPSFFTDAQCDCGCGSVDPACEDTTPAACDVVWCADGREGGFVRDDDITACFSPTCTDALGAQAWPGADDVDAVDAANPALASNLSGVAFAPAQNGISAALWTVTNSPPSLRRLVFSPASGAFVDDAANWPGGATLTFANGAGSPDAEGVTVDGDGAVVVASERDGDGVSALQVMRYSVGTYSPTLVATEEWDLTAIVASRGTVATPNGGFEAIAFIPDGDAVSLGMQNASTSTLYEPSNYPAHGGGVFVLGLEETGALFVVVLPEGQGAVVLDEVASGLPEVMALAFDPLSKTLLAGCDDNCGGQVSVLGVNAPDTPNAGRFEAFSTLLPPPSLAAFNLEGIALGPSAPSQRPFYWVHDGGGSPGALLQGSFAIGGICPAP